VTLVQLPGIDDGDAHAVSLLKTVPEGTDGSLKHRSVSDVELQVRLGHMLTSSCYFKLGDYVILVTKRGIRQFMIERSACTNLPPCCHSH
jgi:hypothetical protein